MNKRFAPIRTASPTLRRIFEIAKEKRVNQYEMADACGSYQAGISEYRTGKVEPGIMMVEEMVRAIGCRIEIVPIDFPEEEGRK